jgi:hypothetical protein
VTPRERDYDRDRTELTELTMDAAGMGFDS